MFANFLELVLVFGLSLGHFFVSLIDLTEELLRCYELFDRYFVFLLEFTRFCVLCSIILVRQLSDLNVFCVDLSFEVFDGIDKDLVLIFILYKIIHSLKIFINRFKSA